jgi:hypothetical protein
MIAFWWLFDQSRWNLVYDTFIIPFAGFLLLPWTTLMYTIVWQVGVGVDGWNWLWVGLALVCDIASYSGSAYGNRDRIPGMPRSGVV